jgi:hypothetical protein
MGIDDIVDEAEAFAGDAAEATDEGATPASAS